MFFRNSNHTILEVCLPWNRSRITIYKDCVQKLLIIEILWKKEVGGQIFIFFTSEVGLDHEVFWETQSFELNKTW